MENNVLEIKNLHVRFDTDDAKVYAVNGVSLALKKCQTLVWSAKRAQERPRRSSLC